MQLDALAAILLGIRNRFGVDDLDLMLLALVVHLNEAEGSAPKMKVTDTFDVMARSAAINRINKLIERGMLRVVLSDDDIRVKSLAPTPLLHDLIAYIGGR